MPQYQGIWSLQSAAQLQSTQRWVTDPSFDYTTLLLQADNAPNGAQNNTFLDSSSNNFTITRNGNTTQGTFTPYSATGWSNYFSGNPNAPYLNLGNQSALQLTTQDFTIEFWWCQTSSTFGGVLGTWRTNGNSYTWYIGAASTSVGFSFSTDGTYQGQNDFIVSAPQTLNEWAHFAIVRSGTSITIFKNGVLAKTSNSMSNIFSTTQQFWIGGIGVDQQFCTGYLSNLRFVKGTALYTSNFTPSTTPLTAVANTSLLTCQSNRFVDNSSNAFTITAAGAFATPSVQAFSPFAPQYQWTAPVIGGSGYFDGTGDSLEIADNTAFTLDGDFTIEGWLYPFSVADSDTFIGKWQPSNQEYLFWPESGVPKFYWAPNSAVTALLTSSVSIPTNAWTHLAVTRSGNSFTMWVNGVSRATATNSSAVTNTSSPVEIGRLSQYPPNYDYQGYMAGVRIVKGTAVYTTGFTPPTAPLTAITNTALLLNFTNAGIYDGTMRNNLETVGNAQVSTSVVKYGTGSMAFDETGDYLTVPSTQNVAFGTGNFTIECWVRFATSSVGNGQGVFQLSNGYLNSAVRGPAVGVDETNNRWAIYYGTTFSVSSFSPLANVWYHVAYVRNSGVSKLYLDGTEIISVSDSTNYTDTNFTIGGWYSSSYLLNGYIDDFRITKGIARYTANFTPPTVALPRQ